MFSVVLVLSAPFLCACGNSKTNETKKEMESSNSASQDTGYSTGDIDCAISAAKAYFEEHFTGCTLTQISYKDNISSQSNDDWAKQFKEDEAIVLVSSFDVGPKGPDGSFDTNCTYDNFQWILTRSGSNDWTVQDYGY